MPSPTEPSSTLERRGLPAPVASLFTVGLLVFAASSVVLVVSQSESVSHLTFLPRRAVTLLSFPAVFSAAMVAMLTGRYLVFMFLYPFVNMTANYVPLYVADFYIGPMLCILAVFFAVNVTDVFRRSPAALILWAAFLGAAVLGVGINGAHSPALFLLAVACFWGTYLLAILQRRGPAYFATCLAAMVFASALLATTEAFFKGGGFKGVLFFWTIGGFSGKHYYYGPFITGGFYEGIVYGQCLVLVASILADSLRRYRLQFTPGQRRAVLLALIVALLVIPKTASRGAMIGEALLVVACLFAYRRRAALAAIVLVPLVAMTLLRTEGIVAKFQSILHPGARRTVQIGAWEFSVEAGSYAQKLARTAHAVNEALSSPFWGTGTLEGGSPFEIWARYGLIPFAIVLTVGLHVVLHARAGILLRVAVVLAAVEWLGMGQSLVSALEVPPLRSWELLSVAGAAQVPRAMFMFMVLIVTTYGLWVVGSDRPPAASRRSA